MEEGEEEEDNINTKEANSRDDDHDSQAMDHSGIPILEPPEALLE